MENEFTGYIFYKLNQENVINPADEIIGTIDNFNIRLAGADALTVPGALAVSFYSEKHNNLYAPNSLEREMMYSCINKYLYLNFPLKHRKAYELGIRNNLAQNIKDYRCNNLLSQEELANELGVERQTISKWETGKSEPNIASLVMLAKLFNVTTDKLITGYVVPDKALFRGKGLFEENKNAAKVLSSIPLYKVKLLAENNNELWEQIRIYVAEDTELPLSIKAFKEIVIDSEQAIRKSIAVEIHDDIIRLMESTVQEVKGRLNNNLNNLVILVKASEDYPMERLFRAIVRVSYLISPEQGSLISIVLDKEMGHCCEINLIGFSNILIKKS